MLILEIAVVGSERESIGTMVGYTPTRKVAIDAKNLLTRSETRSTVVIHSMHTKNTSPNQVRKLTRSEARRERQEQWREIGWRDGRQEAIREFEARANAKEVGSEPGNGTGNIRDHARHRWNGTDVYRRRGY